MPFIFSIMNDGLLVFYETDSFNINFFVNDLFSLEIQPVWCCKFWGEIATSVTLFLTKTLICHFTSGFNNQPRKLSWFVVISNICNCSKKGKFCTRCGIAHDNQIRATNQILWMFELFCKIISFYTTYL